MATQHCSSRQLVYGLSGLLMNRELFHRHAACTAIYSKDAGQRGNTFFFTRSLWSIQSWCFDQLNCHDQDATLCTNVQLLLYMWKSVFQEDNAHLLQCNFQNKLFGVKEHQEEKKHQWETWIKENEGNWGGVQWIRRYRKVFSCPAFCTCVCCSLWPH